MEEYVSIERRSLKFKHLISGPATVGRILNYLIYIGEGRLYHKNGNRRIGLIDGIGSAWTTEFMVGLGLAYYDDNSDQPVLLYLTPNGKKVYSCIKDYGASFNESRRVDECKQELIGFSHDAFLLLKQAFLDSPVYTNLHAFIAKKKTNVFEKKSFCNDYYLEFYNYYGIRDSFNADARTTAAKNRVPSLIQLCLFFNFVCETQTTYTFSLPQAKKTLGDMVGFSSTNEIKSEDVFDMVDDLSNDLAVNDATGYTNETDVENSNNRKPSLIEGDHTNHRFTTDPKLGKTAIERANYICELDGVDNRSHGTFDSPNGHQYLEAHHLIPMKAQKDFPGKNLDRLENIVAICPNCHRAIHYGALEEKIKYLKPLYDKRIQQLKECEHHIDISFEDLITKYYK